MARPIEEFLNLPTAEVDALVPYLMAFPEAIEILTVRTVDADPNADGLGLYVRGTRLFVNTKAFFDLRGSLLVAAAAYAQTQSVELTVFTGLAVELSQKFKLLSTDQAEVLDVIHGLTGGHPYKRHVTLDDLRRAYRESAVDVTAEVDELVEGKVLRRDSDGLLMRL